MNIPIPSQKKSLHTISAVYWHPGCPVTLLSWYICRISYCRPVSLGTYMSPLNVTSPLSIAQLGNDEAVRTVLSLERVCRMCWISVFFAWAVSSAWPGLWSDPSEGPQEAPRSVGKWAAEGIGAGLGFSLCAAPEYYCVPRILEAEEVQWCRNEVGLWEQVRMKLGV